MSVWRTGVVGAGNFEDPENARIIYLAAGGLVLLAVLLAVGTWLWWRRAKVEHPVLGPLEVMGTRRWRKADDLAVREKALAEVRLAGDAEDAAAGDLTSAAPAPEPVDLEAAATSAPIGFDDLAEPEPEPAGAPIDPLLRLQLDD